MMNTIRITGIVASTDAAIWLPHTTIPWRICIFAMPMVSVYISSLRMTTSGHR